MDCMQFNTMTIHLSERGNGHDMTIHLSERGNGHDMPVCNSSTMDI